MHSKLHISPGSGGAFNEAECDEQIREFITHFRDRTKTEPSYIIKAPGRINLIGDHIDYHGFSVLPMAIDRFILLGVNVEDGLDREIGQMRIINKDSEAYQPFQGQHSFVYGSQLDKSHQWHYYVLCGYHGSIVDYLLNVEADQVFEHSRKVATGDSTERCNITQNLTFFIDSNLPPASGLSSSSALVCASTLATLVSLIMNGPFDYVGSDENFFREVIAAKCAKFEHLIGTNGGGMDQAVILTAQEGYAKYVEFLPSFKCTNVRLPQNAVWLVSHCGEDYAKAATLNFNTRVLETKLAAALIIKEFGAHIYLDHNVTLAQAKREAFPLKSTAEIEQILVDFFKGREVTNIDKICCWLDIRLEQLVIRFKTSEEFIRRTGLDQEVHLLDRCLHVFKEAERVEQFKLICEETGNIHSLGRLMVESHLSLRDLYSCSHPKLDELVDISLEAGSLGARLTGAGWGGCIVSLVEKENCDRVLAELEKVSKFTFKTEPSSGCSVIPMMQPYEQVFRTLRDLRPVR